MPVEPDTASVEQNKALIRRFYAEIDGGNINAMDELVAENYLNHHPPPISRTGTWSRGAQASVPDVFDGDAWDARDSCSDRGR